MIETLEEHSGWLMNSAKNSLAAVLQLFHEVADNP
jgi:hypothetical protein